MKKQPAQKRRLNERGVSEDRRSEDSDDAMTSGETRRDKELQKQIDELQDLILQQGLHNTRMVAHSLEQEWSQALLLKVVRPGRDTSARNWHAAVDKLQSFLEETQSGETSLVCKVEAEVWLLARSEKSRQRLNDILKLYVGKAADLQEAMVVLGRPSMRTALSKPCTWIYGHLRNQIQGRPAPWLHRRQGKSGACRQRTAALSRAAPYPATDA